jgi:DNA-binding CsgD family transcriptional regulator
VSAPSPSPGAFRPSDDEIVAAVLDGATLTRQIADRLGGNVYAISHALRWLAEKGRVKRVGYLSDGTTAVWGPPDA